MGNVVASVSRQQCSRDEFARMLLQPQFLGTMVKCALFLEHGGGQKCAHVVVAAARNKWCQLWGICYAAYKLDSA